MDNLTWICGGDDIWPSCGRREDVNAVPVHLLGVAEGPGNRPTKEGSAEEDILLASVPEQNDRWGDRVEDRSRREAKEDPG